MRCYGPRTSSCNPTVAAQEVKSVVLSDIGYFMLELQRAKHTSKAPLVRKIIDNLSSRENLVLASLYERLSSTQTFGASQCHLRFWVFSIIINTFHIPLAVIPASIFLVTGLYLPWKKINSKR